MKRFFSAFLLASLVLLAACGEETVSETSSQAVSSSEGVSENSEIYVSRDVSNTISEESETSNDISADASDTFSEESNEASDDTSKPEEPKETTKCGINFYNWLTEAAKAAATHETGVNEYLVEGHQLSSMTILMENGEPVVIDYPTEAQILKTYIVELCLSREGYLDYQGYFHISKNAAYLEDFCARFGITDRNWEDFYFTPDEIMAFDDVSCDDLKSVFEIGLNMSGVKLSVNEKDK